MTCDLGHIDLWVCEWGEEYAVPELISRAEGIEDMSWHNDANPSFGRHVPAEGDEYAHELRIWVEHPDPAERNEGAARYEVAYYCNTTDPVPEFGECASLHEGEDALEALKVFMTALTRTYVHVGRS